MRHHSKANVRLTLQVVFFVYGGGADSTSTNTTSSADNTVNCIFSLV